MAWFLPIMVACVVRLLTWPHKWRPSDQGKEDRLLGFSTTFAIFYLTKQSRACHVQGMGISPSLDKRGGWEARGHCRTAGQHIVVWLSLKNTICHPLSSKCIPKVTTVHWCGLLSGSLVPQRFREWYWVVTAHVYDGWYWLCQR